MIGAPITTWEGAGAYYAGSGSELLWVIISLVICVAALIGGLRHEKQAYGKLK